jgi:MFS superfamily sulfate permease-like transporter
MAGGIIVGLISGSHLSVSGPAAGLTVIVAAAILQLGDFHQFLLAVIIAGLLQIIFGLLKAGKLGEYVPNNVIRGMMAAIGLILILKQIPHLVGYDHDFEGDEDFVQMDGENTFSEILQAAFKISPGAALIGLISMAILLLWETKYFKKNKSLKFIPGTLVVVIVGIVYTLLSQGSLGWGIAEEHLVTVPKVEKFSDWIFELRFPDWNAWTNIHVWTIGITIALVASLESLLGIEAVDKLDPLKRNTPSSLELIAQGVGNITSGLIGGIPVTSVVVRSTANISAGATHKTSAILHGLWLVISVIFFPFVLNQIPLASLAAILIFVGYKLVKPSIFIEIWKQGKIQFIPFIVTLVAILSIDLLKGIGIGLLVGLFFVIKRNFKKGIALHEHDGNYLIRFQQEVTFLNRPLLKETLAKIPAHAHLLMDLSRNERMDEDILEMINDYKIQAQHNHIVIEFKYNAKGNTHQNL